MSDPFVFSVYDVIMISFVFSDVWGFDYEAVEVLKQMKPMEDTLSHRFAFLLQNNNKLTKENVKAATVRTIYDMANLRVY